MPDLRSLHSFAELWHPEVLAWVVLLQAAYLLMVGPLRRGFHWGAPVPINRQIYASIGFWIVYLAEGTPLHVIAENYLFSAHMLQHVLMTMVMPPLVLLGMPAWFYRPLLRWRPTAVIFRFLTNPVVGLLLFSLIFGIWHMPVAYQAVLFSHTFHIAQHGILVFTAFMMWWSIASPVPEAPPLSEGGQMIFIFLAGVMQIAVHGLITFAEHPIYHFYENAPRLWGIDPMTDQQFSGMIMNIGGMIVMITVWAIVFFRWAGRESDDRRVMRASS
jgi:putative membrane protein